MVLTNFLMQGCHKTPICEHMQYMESTKCATKTRYTCTDQNDIRIISEWILLFLDCITKDITNITLGTLGLS